MKLLGNILSYPASVILWVAMRSPKWKLLILAWVILVWAVSLAYCGCWLPRWCI